MVDIYIYIYMVDLWLFATMKRGYYETPIKYAKRKVDWWTRNVEIPLNVRSLPDSVSRNSTSGINVHKCTYMYPLVIQHNELENHNFAWENSRTKW